MPTPPPLPVPIEAQLETPTNTAFVRFSQPLLPGASGPTPWRFRANNFDWIAVGVVNSLGTVATMDVASTSPNFGINRVTYTAVPPTLLDALSRPVPGFVGFPLTVL